MNHRAGITTARAFTLIELLATIMVLGLSVAAVLPILSSVSDGARRAQTIARQNHEASIAIERIAELLRESGDPSGSKMLTVLAPTEFRLATGRGVQLSKGNLIERDTRGGSKPLARGITSFQLTYLRDDGATTTGIAAQVHTVEVALKATDVACATRVFLRGRMAIP